MASHLVYTVACRGWAGGDWRPREVGQVVATPRGINAGPWELPPSQRDTMLPSARTGCHTRVRGSPVPLQHPSLPTAVHHGPVSTFSVALTPATLLVDSFFLKTCQRDACLPETEPEEAPHVVWLHRSPCSHPVGVWGTCTRLACSPSHQGWDSYHVVSHVGPGSLNPWLQAVPCVCARPVWSSWCSGLLPMCSEPPRACQGLLPRTLQAQS